jgi:hypothetical protein
MQNENKIRLRISPQAASYLEKETPREEKLKAAKGQVALSPNDLVVLLLCMTRNMDEEIGRTALETLRELPIEVLTAVCDAADANPGVLDVIAKLHFRKGEVFDKIMSHSRTHPDTVAFLASQEAPTAPADPQAAHAVLPEPPTGCGNTAPEAPPPEEAEDSEKEDEEFKSKYQLAQQLGVKEKIKMALTGDKEWRMLLVKDNNNLVSESVLKNPRITDQEVLVIAKSSLKNDEIFRIVCTNKDWTKNYQIKKALIENSKTPLQHSLRFLSSLTEKDLGLLAKSKNVSSVITTQARRMLFNKKMGQ